MPLKKLKLESKTRFKVKACPCGKSNSDGKFVPFEGYEKFGYCHACSKTFYPNNEFDHSIVADLKSQPKPKIITFPKSYLIQSTKKVENNLSTFLLNRFDPINVAKAIKQYHLGNSKLWKGASVLWYINTNQKITTGKIMLFNQDTSKRVTKPFHHINWVHNVLGIPNENINKCLFGEHLLDEFPDKPVAIVESEKTAIIASICLPDFIWMATGGVKDLSYERLKPLKNKKLFCSLISTLMIFGWRRLTISNNGFQFRFRIISKLTLPTSKKA
ncbi:MAG: hypothetical protein IPL10_02345 [Bacteroidetes bacterium]|nr:hypothetical protein [Bacteroidota bacterium]